MELCAAYVAQKLMVEMYCLAVVGTPQQRFGTSKQERVCIPSLATVMQVELRVIS